MPLFAFWVPCFSLANPAESSCDIIALNRNFKASVTAADSLSNFSQLFRCCRKLDRMDTLLQHEHSINTLLRKGESVGYRTLMDLRLSRAHISQTKRHFIEYLNELNRAYRIENILPLDSLHLARGYNFCYSELGMHSKALEFLVLSHKLAERLDQESLIIKWGELASIHYKIREYQKAIEYEKRHLDTYPIEKTEHNGASHYNNIGLYFLRLNQIDSAG